MNDLSQLYPDLIIGNALRSQPVPSNNNPQPSLLNQQQGLFFDNGGVNYNQYIGNGLFSSMLKPSQLMLMWADHLNKLRLQGGKDNWNINYERKF